jgi:hypothetical protein
VPAIETVYTEVETEAAMDDVKLNPVVDNEDGEVIIQLSFRGVSIDPELIFDALKNLGTVQSDVLPARHNYRFIINP